MKEDVQNLPVMIAIEKFLSRLELCQATTSCDQSI